MKKASLGKSCSSDHLLHGKRYTDLSSAESFYPTIRVFTLRGTYSILNTVCAEFRSWEEATLIYIFFMWKSHLVGVWSRYLSISACHFLFCRLSIPISNWSILGLLDLFSRKWLSGVLSVLDFVFAEYR